MTHGGKFPRMTATLGIWALLVSTTVAQTAAPVSAPEPAPFHVELPHSHNPFSAYIPSSVADPVLSNSPRLQSLIVDGKLHLSLRDAIALALENNLDLAIARYNLPIADTDILRTQAGGFFRGVNAGVVQGTPGGGGSSLSGGSSGGGAGGTSGGAGGAGTGASGTVQSTLGVGSAVSSYDPNISGTLSNEHYTSPQSNKAIYGVPSLQANTTLGSSSPSCRGVPGDSRSGRNCARWAARV